REIRLLYRGVSSSLANSSGIFLGGAAYCDLVRPGVAIYGVNPTPGKKNPMRPVVDLKGRIIQVRPVTKGDTVGYGAAFTASPPAWGPLATRFSPISGGATTGFTRASDSGPVSRAQRHAAPRLSLALRRIPDMH